MNIISNPIEYDIDYHYRYDALTSFNTYNIPYILNFVNSIFKQIFIMPSLFNIYYALLFILFLFLSEKSCGTFCFHARELALARKQMFCSFPVIS